MIGTALLWAALLHLIVVHGPTGSEIDLNINEISSLRKPEASADEHIAKNVRCVVLMANGRIIGTRETCVEIVDKIAAINREEK